MLNEVALEGTQIHYINYLDLIEDKKATARQKGKDDIKQLRRVRGEK